MLSCCHVVSRCYQIAGWRSAHPQKWPQCPRISLPHHKNDPFHLGFSSISSISCILKNGRTGRHVMLSCCHVVLCCYRLALPSIASCRNATCMMPTHPQNGRNVLGFRCPTTKMARFTSYSRPSHPSLLISSASCGCKRHGITVCHGNFRIRSPSKFASNVTT